MHVQFVQLPLPATINFDFDRMFSFEFRLYKFMCTLMRDLIAICGLTHIEDKLTNISFTYKILTRARILSECTYTNNIE